MTQRATWKLVQRYSEALREYGEASASLEGLIGPQFAEAYRAPNKRAWSSSWSAGNCGAAALETRNPSEFPNH